MAKKTTSAKTQEKDIIRATFRFHGPELAQLREIRDMLSLNSELDAARYLMQRGLEAMTGTLTTRRTQAQMAQGVSAEQIIKQMVAMGLDPTKPQ